MQDDGRENANERVMMRSWRTEGFVVWRKTRPFSPPTDVIEFEDRLQIVIEIAGMRATDLKVHLIDQRLSISGVRERAAHQNAAYHQVEIGYGEFRVDVILPWTVEGEAISASYRDGFLRIDIPRRPKAHFQVVDVHADNPPD